MKGKELRAIRQRRQLSLALFAPHLGVHWNTLARYERGELRIPEPVAKLAVRLDLAERLGPSISTSERPSRPFPHRTREKKGTKRMGRLKYNPTRGGPVPGHLRNAFEEFVAKIDFEEAGMSHLTVTVNDENKPLRWLIGQLWNCRDRLQGAACDDLDLPRGTTYAQAVRRMASTLESEETLKMAKK